MKIVYFDCFAGISGDMILGSLIDLGLDPEALTQELRKLPLDGYRLEFSRTKKAGIQAAQFKVILSGSHGEHLADSEFKEVDLPNASSELHGHHSESHGHADHQHGAQQHRSLHEILSVIERSGLSPQVKSTAMRIFNRLAEAEARVHGGSVDQVHFHEVGGVDAIIDITGAAIALELLGVEKVYASALHLGSGFVRMQHGLYPVPAPATANLITGVPAYTSEVKGELVTPTGAAIITTIASGFGPMPPMKTLAVGYGAGSRERDFPNVLRAFFGEEFSASASTRQKYRPVRTPFPEQHEAEPGPAGYHESAALVVEANIDDMNPQLFENLGEKLLQAGALDVVLIPVQMKKGRPGMILQVLVYPPSLDDLLAIIFNESTSIGVRTYEVTKRMLQRESQTVETAYGTVRFKVARLGERIVNVSPEYEDCLELAQQQNQPVKAIYADALAAARRLVALK